MGKHRVIIVGCGAMASAWIKVTQAMPQVTIAALVDLNLANAQARAEEFALTEALVTTDFAEALAKTAANVVFNITVPQAHTTVTTQALVAGCHVLSEKPLTDSMSDARQLIALAAQHDRQFAVIQNRRYLPKIITVRDFVRSGQLGRLHTLNADFYLGPHFGGFREEMDHVLLLDMAIHTFDQARFLSESDPLAVYCHEYNPPSSWFAHGAAAQAIFEMSDGIVFNYRGAWCAEGLPTPWESGWRLVGEKGTLLWDGENDIRVELATKEGSLFRETESQQIAVADFAEARQGHGGVIHEFFSCLETNNTPQTTAADNIKSLAMVFAAHQKRWVLVAPS